MNADDAEEYTQAVGQVVSGGWRQIALGDRLGVPKALGLTTREWVDHRLGGYVRLSLSDRREAVAELTGEGMTQREVAEVLGVGVGTVNRDLVPDGTPEPADLPIRADLVPDGTPEPAGPDDEDESSDGPDTLLTEYLQMLRHVVQLNGNVPFEHLSPAARNIGDEAMSLLLKELHHIHSLIKGQK